MKASDKGDILKFVFNTVAVVLIVVGIIQAYAPYVGIPDVRESDVREASGRIVMVTGDDIPALLHAADGKPVMLVLYAAWCGPCHVEMPRIISLMQEGRLNSVHPLFLSLDEGPRALAIYLVHHEYHKLFTPYLYQEEHMLPLLRTLHAAGSHFSGSIPYTGIFDAQGKLVAETLGAVDSDELLQAMEKAIKNPHP